MVELNFYTRNAPFESNENEEVTKVLLYRNLNIGKTVGTKTLRDEPRPRLFRIV